MAFTIQKVDNNVVIFNGISTSSFPVNTLSSKKINSNTFQLFSRDLRVPITIDYRKVTIPDNTLYANINLFLTALSSVLNSTVSGNSVSVNFKDAFYVPENYNFADITAISNIDIVISQNHDLNGATVNFGSNKNIYIQGGTLIDGILNGTNCQLISDKTLIFPSNDISFTGTWINNIYPEWWSLKTTSDWQPALQSAFNFARLSSNKVILSAYKYTYYNQLTIYEGTTIQGVSRGDTAFGNASIKGTVLHCLGSSLGSTANDNIAMKVVGRMVNFSNFVLKGERSISKYGDGLVIYGIGDGSSNQALIENCNFENILIHGFMKGKGLSLVAGNSGAVTYSNFINIRTRDCAEHVSIECFSANPIYSNIGSTGLSYTNTNAFINSNNFVGLYMSGYCESGLKVYTEYDAALTNSQLVYRPANNLTFNGVIIEPPYSNNSHIRIEGAGSSVRMHDIRVEASQQDAQYPEVPVVYLSEGTNSNVIDCDQMSVPILDLGFNNHILGHNSKNGNSTPNSNNLYKNSALIGLDKTGANVYLPEWTIEEQCIDPLNTYAWRVLQSDSSIIINESVSVVEDGYKVLTVTVPANFQFRMNQAIDRTLHNIPTAKVNCKIKATNLKDVIWTYQDSVTPVVSGGTDFGGDIWEQMGAFFVVTQPELSSYYRISIFCQNYTESDITFSFTMPSFVTGEITPKLPAKQITEIGGTVYGVMSYNTVKNIKPLTNSAHRGSAATDVILPLEGNYFEINETGFSIQKINATVNRFNRGSVITLIFNYADITVVDSSFINLNKAYISEVGSTLTLQSANGDGLWIEIGRSERKTIGLYTGEIDQLITTNYLVLDTTDNIFNLSNANDTNNTISRINYTSRFNPGSQITLNFATTNAKITFSNSAYLTLSHSANYIPKDGDWIKLETIGDGTWYEIGRKKLLGTTVTNGNTNVETSTATSSNILTLPLTGENYFILNNTSGGAITIARINDISTLRFNPGTRIIIKFGTLTSAINISNSSYISLKYTGTFTPTTGEWMELITTGDGTWLEIDRKTNVTAASDMSITLSSTYLATNFLTLPLTGENYFKLSCATTGGSISRINNAAGFRFGGGKILMIEFTNITVAPTLVNSGYLILSGGVNYVPALNGGIVLYTRGDGTWRELSRF